MLLRQKGIIPPLVFRPWYDIEMQPWMITLRNRTDHEALHQFDVGGEMDDHRVVVEQVEMMALRRRW